MAVDSAGTSNSSATIGTSSGAVVPARSGRLGVYICNDHATQVAYLALGGTATANTGIRLGPGEKIRIDDYRGAINAIATGITTVLTIAEY